MYRVAAQLATVLVAVSSLALMGSQQPGQQPPDAEPGEVIVQFRPDASQAQRAAIRAAHATDLVRRFETLDMQLLRVGPGRDVAAAVAALLATPGVVLAQPNYRRQAIAPPPPNDPFWLNDTLWGLQRIQAQQAWTNFTTGDPGVIVANLDTGVNYLHPDLAANMWQNPGEIPANGQDDDDNGYIDDVYGIDAFNHDSDPMDDH